MRPSALLACSTALLALACGGQSDVLVTAAAPTSAAPGDTFDLALTVRNQTERARPMHQVVFPDEMANRVRIVSSDPPWTSQAGDTELTFYYDGVDVAAGGEVAVTYQIEAVVPGRVPGSIEVHLDDATGRRTFPTRISGASVDIIEYHDWVAPARVNQGDPITASLSVTNNGVRPDRLTQLKFDDTTLASNGLALTCTSHVDQGTSDGNFSSIENMFFDIPIAPGETVTLVFSGTAGDKGRYYDPVSVRLDSTGVFSTQKALEIEVQ